MSKRTAGKPEPAIAEQSVSKQARASKRVSLAICVFLILATAIVYVQVAWFPFVDLDDGLYIYGNHYVQDAVTAKSIGWAFTTFRSANWHPLTWISHMIDCQLYGLAHPGGHHVTNLLLHIANALLLFLLLSRMTGAVWRSGFVAALFALHPLHVESVAWVAERKDLLSTFFWMLTVLAYVHYSARRGIGRYMLVFCAYALGLLSKPMLVSLPLVLLMLDWWPLQRAGVKGSSLGRLVMEKIPLFILAAGSCVVTYFAQLHSGAASSLQMVPMSARVANALVSYVVYIRKMLWPVDLTMLYPRADTLPVWLTITCGIALTLTTFLAIRMRRKLPYVFVGWLWYVVMLVPVIGIVQVGIQAYAERYTYVPLIGLFIIVTWGAADALASVRAEARRVTLAALAAAVMISLSICAWTQVGYWRSTDLLNQHAFEVTRGDNVIRCLLASRLTRQGKVDEATNLLRHASADRPGMVGVHNALGRILASKGKMKEAEAELRLAIRLQPTASVPHSNLGDVLRRQGRLEDAMREFQKAASLDAWYADPHFKMAAMLASVGKTDEALREYDETVRLDPERTDARCKAAAIVLQQGMLDEALSRATAAIEVDPTCAYAYYVTGCVLRRQAVSAQIASDSSLSALKLDDALSNLRRAVEIEPRWGPPHSSIAMALFMKGDCAGAWRETRIAQRCGALPDPNFLKALSQRMPEPRR